MPSPITAPTQSRLIQVWDQICLSCAIALLVQVCFAQQGFAQQGLGQQGAEWFVHGSDAGMRIVGASSGVLRGRSPDPLMTPPGEFAVHFGRDALGKPDSLRMTVPGGARVRVAVEPAGPAKPISVEAPMDASYLVAATAVTSDSAGRIGLIARKFDDDNWYRFIWDRDREQFRLERSMGGAIIVINTAPAPPADEEAHELAFQVEGFRLRAFFDDVLVLSALDGAHQRGSCETWQTKGTQVQWQGTVTEMPAPPRSSSALVQLGNSAIFVSATGAAAGHYHVLELALDRPHPIVPLTEAGLELWLLQRPAAPRILLGQFRDDLGSGTIGELPTDGRMQCGLRWPSGPALANQAALVRVLVVSPDGDRLVSRTPSVPVQI